MSTTTLSATKAKPKNPVCVKSKELQEHLSSRGITMDVSHVRPMGIVVLDPATGEEEWMLSRDEFNKTLKGEITLVDSFSGGSIPEGSVYGQYVGACGGFTRVTLTDATGKEYVGKYNFSPMENFFKAKGVLAACNRALKGTGILNGT